MDLSIIKASLHFRTELTGMASADWGPRIELGCLAFSGSLMLINTIQPGSTLATSTLNFASGTTLEWCTATGGAGAH